ncbi:MAG: ABC transporter ATP-binding protein [Proteobacteria bacterium]|nr:ABC transporter ATP-binding protein [Pseudomonadota bacterium]NOG60438.1 ABC transporter ATP-binding protein [Pseudomonadota bacterium]
MAELALNIKQLNQHYGKHAVLTDINLSVEQGEYIGLVGINGAGKTTLIKSVLDFISTKTGEIEIFGQSHRETSSRQSLSFLPEKFLPPYYLTGKDFLSYMAELNQVELEQADIEEIFKVLDLELSALKKSVRQYSKGMAQKLGLASCFLSQRPMLLFDEPMSGLDPKARAYLKRHLNSLKETGKTLFFSTHLLADVESICDRIVILHNGEICFNGSPYECCEQFHAESLEYAYLKCIGVDD